jgi:hypothetical protein
VASGVLFAALGFSEKKKILFGPSQHCYGKSTEKENRFLVDSASKYDHAD